MVAARLSFVVTLVGAACVAGATPGAEGAKDRDRVRGEWRVVSVQMYGKEAPGAEAFKRGTWAISGGKITLTLGPNSTTFGYTLDSAKKTIDLTQTSGPHQGETYPGIYKLDGDTLTVCYAKDGRPTMFATKPGAEQVLIVFRRLAK